MKISLENAVKATSEYLNKEFSAMGEDKDKRWAAFGMHMIAEYKMATAGTKALKMLDDGTGFIDLDVLDGFIGMFRREVLELEKEMSAGQDIQKPEAEQPEPEQTKEEQAESKGVMGVP